MSDTSPSSPAEAERHYGAPRQKVPPFARYEGTSAWRKYRNRVREYTRFQAADQARQDTATPKA